MMQTKEPQLQPNVRIFNSVLDAYASRSSEDTAMHAQDLLVTLEKGIQVGDSSTDSIYPNRICYSSVMKAWERSSSHEASRSSTGAL